ncbi:hypothetical protein EEB14_33980 [Rhodococcus sp. WS4]|nr:hypothetical protein EEB14_33980 [Rhodococcus sp. WS4]
MANPLTDFIDIRDQFGTQLSDLSVSFTVKMTNFNWIWAGGSEFAIQIALIVSAYSLWLLSLVSGHGFFLELAAAGYQMILDSIYQYVNPMVIGLIAFVVLMARMFIGDKFKMDSKGHINGVEFNYATFADESFAKKITNQVGNTAILLVVIIVMMSNPFALINFAFDVIRTATNKLSGAGGAATAAVDGGISPMLQMVNYKVSLADACAATWSRSLAAAGEVNKLDCLTAAQRNGAVADPVTLIVAFAALFVVAGLVYFAWQTFKRASWFVCRTVSFIGVVPWQAAMLIANPGQDRHKLDSIKDTFMSAVKSLFWLLVCFFVAGGGPGIVMGLGELVQGFGLPPFLALLAVSGLYGGLGWVVKHWVGYDWRKDKKTGKWVKVEGDGTSGWQDFRQNNTTMVALTDSWRDAQNATPKKRTLGGDAAAGGTAHENETKGQPTVDAATNPVVDEVTNYVELTEHAQTAKSLLVSRFSVTSGLGALDAVPSSEFIEAEIVDVEHFDESTSESVRTQPSISSVGRHAAPDSAAMVIGGAMLALGAAGGQSHSGRVTTGSPGGDGAVSAAHTAHEIGPASAVGSEPGPPQTVSGHVTTAVASADATATRTVDGGTDAEGIARPSRESLIASYRDALDEINSTDELTSESALGSDVHGNSSAGSTVSAAFARAQITRQPSTQHTGPQSSSTVTAGSGEFLAAADRDASWDELVVLARTLGQEPDVVIAEGDSDQHQILFYSSTSDGKNVIKYRTRQGFGDDI